MSFVSVTFPAFLAGVLVLYYCVPARFQWILLLTASYAFYLSGGMYMLLFILITTITVFFGGRWMQYIKDTSKSKRAAKKINKRILLGEVILNFGILILLKYYNFAASNLDSFFGLFHYDTSLPLINIVLPLGISFYTFQATGYCIDIYRDKYEAETSLPRFALFVSFFPQIVQGPISRYDQLGPQLKAYHPLEYQNLAYGAQLMLWGYFKKMVIADRAGILVSQVFNDYGHYDGFQYFIAMVTYAIQIYADFSGGIDMTRGAAEMMGIHLTENFRRPYFAVSVAEYWRRWHISLTNWMRDYVFFPITLSRRSGKIGKWGKKHLGGTIGKQLPTYLPTFVTFTLIGIWHGAGWGFIVYGFYNALVIILGMMCTPVFGLMKKNLHIPEKSFGWKIWGIVRTFLIMVYGKTLSRAANLPAALTMIRKSFFWGGEGSVLPRLTAMGLNGPNLTLLLLAIAVFFTVSVIQENGTDIRPALAEKALPVRWIVYFALIISIVIFGVYGEGYSASEFVYRNY